MSAIKQSFPYQYTRQYGIAPFEYMSFATTAEREAYLTNNSRYKGMEVLDEEEDEMYFLSADRSTWRPITSLSAADLEERIDDRVAVLIQNGTGISWAYNDTAGTLTPTVTLAPFDTDDLAEGATNLYYTNARADARINAAAGVTIAPLVGGLIPMTYLPSYVDDVLEFANLASFPNPGETGKIYIALDTNKTYRWSGSTYVYITSGAVDSVNGGTGVVVITITGTTNRIAVSGGQGQTPTIDIAAGYIGQASITTVGTIGTGTWQASVIGSNYGGAGSVNGILKANGSGVVSAAVAGTDYMAPSSSFYLGTTLVSLNRASGSQTITGLSIDGNAGTVTNGVYTSGSYSNPTWITSLAWGKITATPTTRNGYGITDVPLVDGTGATGTWAINISGNAATATNSTQWNGYTNLFSAGVYNSGLGSLSFLVYDATNVNAYRVSASYVQTMLGLGSAAYQNTSAFAPATGSGNYIQNQFSGPQGAEMYISGRGRFGGIIRTFHSTSGENNVDFQNSSSTGYGMYSAGGGNGGGRYIAIFANYTGAARYTIDDSGNNVWAGSGTFGGTIYTNGGNIIQNGGTYPYFQQTPSGWGGDASFIQSGVDAIASGTGNYTLFYLPTGKSFGVSYLGSNKLAINATNALFSTNLLAGADNTYDFGASGANRYRHLYISQNGTFGSTVSANGVTAVAYISINSGNPIYLDGASDTYLQEVSSNVARIVTGGSESARFFASGISVSATNLYFLDGGGDTYIQEVSANIARIVVGGAEMLRVRTDGIYSQGFISVNPTNVIYLDGGSDTYFQEASANIARVVAGGGEAMRWGASHVAIPAGNALYLDGASDTYIQEVSANTVRIIAGGGESVRFTSTLSTFSSRVEANYSGLSLYLNGSNPYMMFALTSGNGYVGQANQVINSAPSTALGLFCPGGLYFSSSSDQNTVFYINTSKNAFFVGSVTAPTYVIGTGSTSSVTSVDSSGTYLEFTGASSGTQRLRLQGTNGSSYVQYFIDAGGQSFYWAINGTQYLNLTTSGLSTIKSITIQGDTTGLIIRSASYSMGHIGGAVSSGDFSAASTAGDFVIARNTTSGYSGAHLILSNQINGYIKFAFGNSSSTPNDTVKAYFTTDGWLYAYHFSETSDKRFKQEIDASPSVVAKIETIKPRLYKINGHTEYGYYAQDVQKILPTAVTSDIHGVLSLTYREVFTAKLHRLETVEQQLIKRITTLEKQVHELKKRIV